MTKLELAFETENPGTRPDPARFDRLCVDWPNRLPDSGGPGARWARGRAGFREAHNRPGYPNQSACLPACFISSISILSSLSRLPSSLSLNSIHSHSKSVIALLPKIRRFQYSKCLAVSDYDSSPDALNLGGSIDRFEFYF